MAFGSPKLTEGKTVLIKNATVWSNEKDGILQNTDVLISNGKITQIGKNINASSNAEIIDGTGKHLTPGIIDEHSHIAISGSVNEGSQSSTAEVRIGDVVDASDAGEWQGTIYLAMKLIQGQDLAQYPEVQVAGKADQVQRGQGLAAHSVYVGEGVGCGDLAEAVGIVHDRREEVDRLQQQTAAERNEPGVIARVHAARETFRRRRARRER